MTTRTEASARVDAAAAASDAAIAQWSAAVALLAPDISVNGYGIIRDRADFRRRLAATQDSLAASLAALEGVPWPTNEDYDVL